MSGTRPSRHGVDAPAYAASLESSSHATCEKNEELKTKKKAASHGHEPTLLKRKCSLLLEDRCVGELDGSGPVRQQGTAALVLVRPLREVPAAVDRRVVPLQRAPVTRPPREGSSDETRWRQVE